MEPHTGVLRLSNKRRQGMKLSYQLNVSVSDGVFTNTAQVRQLHSICTLGLLVDLDYSSARTQESRRPFFRGPSLQPPHWQLSGTFFSLNIACCSAALQFIVNVYLCHVGFAMGMSCQLERNVHICLLVVITRGTLVSHIYDNPDSMWWQ